MSKYRRLLPACFSSGVKDQTCCVGKRVTAACVRKGTSSHEDVNICEPDISWASWATWPHRKCVYLCTKACLLCMHFFLAKTPGTRKGFKVAKLGLLSSCEILNKSNNQHRPSGFGNVNVPQSKIAEHTHEGRQYRDPVRMKQSVSYLTTS